MTIRPLKTEWRAYAAKWDKVCRLFAVNRTSFWLSGRNRVREVTVLAVEDGGYIRIPARGDNVRRVRVQNIHLSRKSAMVEFSRAAARRIAVPRTGRPKTGQPKRSRMLGRVSDANWDLMHQAAKAAGRTFTDWATAELLAAARIRLSGDRADRQGTEAVPEPDGP